MQSIVPTVLLISPFEEDHEFFRGLLPQTGGALRSAISIASASLLMREPPALIITEAHLPVGTWKDVLDIVVLLPATPLVVVASRLADEYLWVEALNLGAHDVLTKPFDSTEAVRVLTTAWMRCEKTRHPGKALDARKAG